METKVSMQPEHLISVRNVVPKPFNKLYHAMTRQCHWKTRIKQQNFAIVITEQCSEDLVASLRQNVVHSSFLASVDEKVSFAAFTWNCEGRVRINRKQLECFILL